MNIHELLQFSELIPFLHCFLFFVIFNLNSLLLILLYFQVDQYQTQPPGIIGNQPQHEQHGTGSGTFACQGGPDVCSRYNAMPTLTTPRMPMEEVYAKRDQIHFEITRQYLLKICTTWE